jgi:hypothetical protein
MANLKYRKFIINNLFCLLYHPKEICPMKAVIVLSSGALNDSASIKVDI